MRAWRSLRRKVAPVRLEDMPLAELLAGLTGSEEAGAVLERAIDGDPRRLPAVIPHADVLPGVGAGLAFRLAAALEISRRAGGGPRGGSEGVS